MDPLKKLVLLNILLVLICFSIGVGNAHRLKICEFDRIYQLGDSISHKGNHLISHGGETETFFKNATGRSSNGLVMIDYIARAAGLPFVPPYKDANADFSHGANFAVAGSTALPSHLFKIKHIFSPVPRTSLDLQLIFMSNHLNSICDNGRFCGEKLENALFMVGEVGGNDYNNAIFQGKTMDELRDMVPQVVSAIINAVKKTISYGGTRVVVPGVLPMGCLPIYQTAFETNISAFETNISTAYDANQCLNQLNEFAKYHNEQLQEAIEKLKQERPNAIIVYGDYYKAYQFLLGFIKVQHGVDTERACCGIGGKYNFNLTRMCGAPHVTVCTDPDRYLSWDGLHLTQLGYKIMADLLLHDIYAKFHCLL